MRKAIPLTIGGAVLAGGAALLIFGSTLERVDCYGKVIFRNNTVGAGFIPAVNSSQDVITFGATGSGGPVTEVTVTPGDLAQLRVERYTDGTVLVSEGVCDPEPSPSPTVEPTHEPTPLPTPTAEPTPTEPPPTPTPGPTATPTPMPTATPTPVPSPTATPSTGPCSWGTDWQGKCLPQPPSVSCAALPDDPPGLLREGFGCDATGGNGTSIIKVTKLGPDGDPGTLRWATTQLSATARRIHIDASLQGEIKLTKGPLHWRWPQTTLYCGDADVTIMPSATNKDGLVFGASHDVIMKGCKCNGYYKGSDPNWIPQQNSGNCSVDGDINATQYAWDSEWASTQPDYRRAMRKSIFDANTGGFIQDDAITGCWGGCQDISFTRNFIHSSYHPTTTGWKGLPLTSPALMRLRLYVAYNVAIRNGERNLIYPREGTHWWVFARNLITDWQWYEIKDYVTKLPNWNSPQGVRVSGMAPNENNMGWGMGNCALGQPLGNPKAGHGSAFDPLKPNSHKGWGLDVDNGGCDSPAGCCAPSCDIKSGADIPCCNPRVAKTKLYFVGNEGDAWGWSRINPPGYKPPPLPFQPDVSRPWARVISEVGSPFKTSQEEQLLLKAAADAQAKCKVPQ